jgi:hypothetical protein
MHFDILDGGIFLFDISPFCVFHQTPNEHDIIFADIRDLSQFPQEEEILFSIGTIFRIKSVKFNVKKKLYQIRLLLTPLDQLTVIKYK